MLFILQFILIHKMLLSALSNKNRAYKAIYIMITCKSLHNRSLDIDHINITDHLKI